jgi:DoxX-like family
MTLSPTSWPLVALLSLFFTFAGSVKVFGWQKKVFDTQMEMMGRYGLNREALVVIGLVECAGAIGLWFQSGVIGAIAALTLLAVSAGALAFHLKFDGIKDGIPAMLTGLVSGVLVANDWPLLVGLL